MLGKIIQDGLPALPLLFDRIFGFGIEAHAHRDGIAAADELNGWSRNRPEEDKPGELPSFLNDKPVNVLAKPSRVPK